MNIFDNMLTKSQARRHARAGTDAKDRIVTTRIGLPPAEVERTSYEYRSAVQQVSDTGRLEELREDYRRGRDLQAILGTPWQYTAGLVVVWGLEAAGSLLILRALGIPAEHRPLPAAALTLAMIGLTKVTVAATRMPRSPTVPPRSSGDSGPSTPGAAAEVDADLNGPTPASALIQWKRYLLPAVYGCLVAAVAASRVMGSDADDVSPFVALAEAIVMVAVTTGPAFAAIWLEEKRAPALELARRVALIRDRLDDEEQRIRKAEKFLTRVDRAQVRWTRTNAELRAGYSTEHELALAENRLNARDDDNGVIDATPSNER